MILNDLQELLPEYKIKKITREDYLGCANANNVGLHFWKSFGMYELRRAVLKDDNRPDCNVIVFEKGRL